MRRRTHILLAALGLVVTTCGGTQPASEAPSAAGTTGPGSSSRVVITTTGGPELAFDVASCTSPGTNVVNLQADGPAGHLDLRASGVGGFGISGATAAEAEIDEIEVADDGSITASGSVTIGSALAVPFVLTGPPGTCP